MIEHLSLEQKVRLLTGADFWSTHPEPAIGLRRMVLSDGPAGVRGETFDERDPSLSLPSGTALGATWDRDLARRYGAALGAEARRQGVDVVLGPTVNLHRAPSGGRHFESLSEDPLLTAELAAAYVEGVQSHGVGATPKHYVANDAETDRLTVDNRIDERTLREVYLAPFEAAVRAGAWLVMSAYNSVNGATMSENPLLRSPLGDEWGFDGVVVSDWTAVRSTEAAALAAQDLAMPGPDGPWGDALVAAVREGRVPESAVDEKVERILRLAARVGALPALPRRPRRPSRTARPWRARSPRPGPCSSATPASCPGPRRRPSPCSGRTPSPPARRAAAAPPSAPARSSTPCPGCAPPCRTPTSATRSAPGSGTPCSRSPPARSPSTARPAPSSGTSTPTAPSCASSTGSRPR